MARAIPLTKGAIAIVDDADYEMLSSVAWYCNHGYAVRKVRRENVGEGQKQTYVLMHRVIMNTPPGMSTDHIDGNRLNNQRSNLRVCTHQENARNMASLPRGASKYKGVVWHKVKQKWQAQLRIDGRTLYLGAFEKEDDAAVAYNLAALREFRPFGRLNMIP